MQPSFAGHLVMRLFATPSSKRPKPHWEIFLPGSGGSGWIRFKDPVDRMSFSPGLPWSLSINLGCSDYFVCSASSDHLNLFMLYLINLVVIGWPGWSGHTYESVHNPIRLLLLLCSFYYLDSRKVVIFLILYDCSLPSRLIPEKLQLHCNK